MEASNDELSAEEEDPSEDEEPSVEEGGSLEEIPVEDASLDEGTTLGTNSVDEAT